MFIISGTKRSGTSMWMQILVAAGMPVLGAKFPDTWGEGALREANPDGFYEGPYRDGVFFATNPNPRSGFYIRPQDSQGTVVKVFAAGVVRTERAFIEGVIANVRPWRAYVSSLRRLRDLDQQQREQDGRDDPPVIRIPAALEWWVENFGLLQDARTRGYPLLLQTYDQMLANPRPFVSRALDLVGGGDLEQALSAVRPERRTQTGDDTAGDSVHPRVAQVFDDFCAAVDAGDPLDGELWERMCSVHRELMPVLAQIKIERAKRIVLDGAPPPPAMMVAASMV